MSDQYTDPVAQFIDAARDAGMEIAGQVVPDGRLHRCRMAGDKKGKLNGWYVLYLDGIPAGSFGSWRTGMTVSWCGKSSKDMTPAEVSAHKERMDLARVEREAEEKRLRDDAKARAAAISAKLRTVDAKHPYIVKKSISPVGSGQLGNMVVIPVKDIDDELHSLQFIMPDGSKRLLTGGRKKGCFARLPHKNGDWDNIIYVTEGWATGCSIWMATHSHVVVCFDSGNLMPVCQALREKHPGAKIVICADDDYKILEPIENPGVTKAIEASDAVGGLVVIPDFGDDRPDGYTDFNDMANHLSISEVAEHISEALSDSSITDVDPIAGEEIDDRSNVISLGNGKAKGKIKKVKAAVSVEQDSSLDWNFMERIIERYVLIYGTDTCYDIQEGIIMQVKNFRLAVTNDYANFWIKSPKRRMILPSQLVFDPSCTCPKEEVNLFRGFDMKPKKGRFAPILELLNHLCAESAETDDGVYEVMDWVLKWLALPLQKPGTKMRSSLVFHGPQGTGKNLFFEIISAIYGRYALIVGQEQLEGQHNDWMSQKLFLIGDEVIARQELYHQKNKLKAFITGETIQVNPKFLPLRTEKNHINVVFLSNEDQPLALEPSDRRYFVVYTPPKRSDSLYDEVSKCIKEGGVEAFYAHLLSLDLGGFNEYSRPIMTVAKRDLIDLGLKPAQRFMYEWVRGFLPLPLMGCSVEQLYQAFMHWCKINGVRFYPEKIPFGSSARKALDISAMRTEDGDPILKVKPIRMPFSRDGQTHVRMWIPAKQGPKQDNTEGEWAVGVMDSFAVALRKFKGSDDRE